MGPRRPAVSQAPAGCSADPSVSPPRRRPGSWRGAAGGVPWPRLASKVRLCAASLGPRKAARRGPGAGPIWQPARPQGRPGHGHEAGGGPPCSGYRGALAGADSTLSETARVGGAPFGLSADKRTSSFSSPAEGSHGHRLRSAVSNALSSPRCAPSKRLAIRKHAGLGRS